MSLYKFSLHNLYDLVPPAHVKVRQVERDNQPMIADQPNRLVCTVPSSNPPAEISWEFESKSAGALPSKPGHYTKKGAAHGTSEYKGYEVENVLQFTPTEDMDKSSVRCIASHPQWNDVKSSAFVLDVLCEF